jgi:hypothetical protein
MTSAFRYDIGDALVSTGEDALGGISDNFTQVSHSFVHAKHFSSAHAVSNT